MQIILNFYENFLRELFKTHLTIIYYKMFLRFQVTFYGINYFFWSNKKQTLVAIWKEL